MGGEDTSIIRVFPRRTKATPRDELAYVGDPPLELPEYVENDWEIHVSCTFTWDRARAEELALSWERFGIPVGLGGPGFGWPGGEFEPGRYLGEGYTITSRGCPNRCWFCDVWQREGGLRELPIRDGWIVQDSNLLACSDGHIRAVIDMLGRQPKPCDLRGLEAKLLRRWHLEALSGIRVGQLWFAYDGPEDLEPLWNAGRMLEEAGYTVGNRKARAYVLIGYQGDNIEQAEARLRETLAAGFMPHAMLWRDDVNTVPTVAWKQFQRLWARPALIAARELAGSVSEVDLGQLALADC